MRPASWRARGRKVRGVLVTTGLALLLLVIVAIVMLAGFGWFRSILAQATSSKPSLVVDSAQGWVVGCTSSGETAAVTLYVQNIGNVPVDVQGETLVLPNGNTVTPVQPVTPTISPGETAEISAVFTWSGTTVSPGQSVYVYIQVSSAGGSTNYVGTAVALESAPGATNIGC